MSNPNYTLEIISHHQQFTNKSLRKYYVNGIDTVGAWGNEPFEVRFKNNTWQKIQVKISVDGTDVFTGQPASTEASDKMWVVNGYGTLALKAWPENNNGGAGFVFTSADNSVALHTHGDMTSRGIIAAAVFVEGHVEPQRLTHEYHYHYPYTYPVYPLSGDITVLGPIWHNTITANTAGPIGGSGTFGLGNSYSASNSVSNNGNTSEYKATMDCLYVDEVSEAAPAADGRRSKSLQSLVAVGAGQHVDQKINYVAGLIKPTFAETVRVKYVWWDDLVAALQGKQFPIASSLPVSLQMAIVLTSI